MFRIVIIATVFTLASASTYSQTLWNQTLAGMTVDDVKRVVLEAVAPPKPLKGSEGTEILLIVPTFDVVGKQFKAEFFFKEARLVFVSLSPTAQEPAHLASSTFDSLLTALRSRYGTELSFRREDNTMFGPLRKVTWTSGASTIELYLIGLGGDSVTMGINYSTKVSAAAGKL